MHDCSCWDDFRGAENSTWGEACPYAVASLRAEPSVEAGGPVPTCTITVGAFHCPICHHSLPSATLQKSTLPGHRFRGNEPGAAGSEVEPKWQSVCPTPRAWLVVNEATPDSRCSGCHNLCPGSPQLLLSLLSAVYLLSAGSGSFGCVAGHGHLSLLFPKFVLGSSCPCPRDPGFLTRLALFCRPGFQPAG